MVQDAAQSLILGASLEALKLGGKAVTAGTKITAGFLAVVLGGLADILAGRPIGTTVPLGKYDVSGDIKPAKIGKMSVEEIQRMDDKTETLVIDADTRRNLEKVLKGYKVDYAIKKNLDNESFTIFFNAGDSQQLAAAFEEYASYVEKMQGKENRPSLQELLDRSRARLEQTEPQKAPVEVDLSSEKFTKQDFRALASEMKERGIGESLILSTNGEREVTAGRIVMDADNVNKVNEALENCVLKSVGDSQKDLEETSARFAGMLPDAPELTEPTQMETVKVEHLTPEEQTMLREELQSAGVIDALQPITDEQGKRVGQQLKVTPENLEAVKSAISNSKTKAEAAAEQRLTNTKEKWQDVKNRADDGRTRIQEQAKAAQEKQAQAANKESPSQERSR